MIQLLFMLLFAEGATALLLMVKIGMLTKLALNALDQLKMGKGPATVKTWACTMSTILLSSIISIFKMQDNSIKVGNVTPVEQVLWRTHILEASLFGYALFLALVIDRLHHYNRKLSRLKKKMRTSLDEVENLKNQYFICKTKEEEASEKIRTLEEEISDLTDKLQKLRFETDEKEKHASFAESHVLALQRQFEKLLLEYDCQFADNQILRSQSTPFKSKSMRRSIFS